MKFNVSHLDDVIYKLFQKFHPVLYRVFRINTHDIIFYIYLKFVIPGGGGTNKNCKNVFCALQICVGNDSFVITPTPNN